MNRQTNPSIAHGYILPNAIAVHSIDNNGNTSSTHTSTVRQNGHETSTLVSFVVPDAADNKTCTPNIYAGRLGWGDTVDGARTVDIFSTMLTDINSTPVGNQRNMQLGRLRFDNNSRKFNFVNDVPASIRSFKGRAGDIYQWEIVAVGDTDVVDIGQDFWLNSSGTPNGIFLEY
jgi:hypothetical protein